MDNKVYKSYFDIDPKYFPAVNEELILRDEVSWQSFYPHDTFINLIEDVVKVLERKKKLSLWVNGAYGTGKSHAALALKRILDADENEVNDYFKSYNLDIDLYNKLKGVKNSGKLLTVHRYGSSNIIGTNSFIMTVQESIKQALTAQDVSDSVSTLKDAILRWLEKPNNAAYFNSLIKSDYKFEFSPNNDVEMTKKIITTSNKEDAGIIISKIFKMAESEGITALKMTIGDLKIWIEDVIKQNKLSAIVFIWDEFTEFFLNNRNNLTGLQEICEMSEYSPFYFVLITHRSSDELFHENSSDKKIIDRFVKPTIEIRMPENTAFKLMGSALKKKEDTDTQKEWENIIAADLWARVPKSSKVVIDACKNVTENDLRKILPIHPYTALILKHLSSLFNSNQRSMFEFIKSNSDDEKEKNFKWFIEKYGPMSDHEYLTCDMLWDYFYGIGDTNLEPNIKGLLATYRIYEKDSRLDEATLRVLKTVLLLQGISEKAYDSVSAFKPTKDNIANAYEGTDLDNGAAVQRLERLTERGINILYVQQLGDGTQQYVALRGDNGGPEIDKIKKELSDKKLSEIVSENEVDKVISFEGALGLRYWIKYATIDNFKSITNEINNTSLGCRIPLVVTFAKNEQEASAISGKVKEYYNAGNSSIVFADTSCCILANARFDTYIEMLANHKYWISKNGQKAQAEGYLKNAEKEIEHWKQELKSAEIQLYIYENREGTKVYGITDLEIKLKQINSEIYTLGIERYTDYPNMFGMSNPKVGVKMGAENGKITGVFSSAKFDKNKNFYAIWSSKSYWTDYPSHPISKIKIALDDMIKGAFDKNGEIDILTIWEALEEKPYGFMKCNLTAFILGFLLKEYAVPDLTWSNGSTTDPMSPEKLAEMVDGVFKYYPGQPRHVRQYIKAMSDEEKAFLKFAPIIFGLDAKICSSVEKTKNEVIRILHSWGFPLWALCEYVNHTSPSLNDEINRIIIGFCDLANNRVSGRKESDIAKEIGMLCLSHNGLAEAVHNIVKSENTRIGMDYYIQKYKGELIDLSVKISDGNRYLAEVNKRLNKEAGWLFHKDHIDEKVDEVIREYKIIVESNKWLSHSTSYTNCLDMWVEKLGQVKMPFDAFKANLGTLEPLFKILYDLYKIRTVIDSNKSAFLDEVQKNGESFVEFFASQFSSFKEAYQFILHGLNDSDITKIFTSIGEGVILKTNSEFEVSLKVSVDRYKSALKMTKLREIWEEKSDCKSPREWSNKYEMPVLFLFDKNIELARRTFDILNGSSGTEVDIDDGIKLLCNNPVFTKIKDKDFVDAEFVSKIVGDNALILKNLPQVRSILKEHVSNNVYEWYFGSALKNTLEQYTALEYKKRGYQEAFNKIDTMDDMSAKEYLKRLIKDNVEVGLAIMKNA